VVGINDRLQPAAKAFTLLREVAHLLLAAGSEEASGLEDKRSDAEWTKAERFAELVARHALFSKTPNIDRFERDTVRFETPAKRALDAGGRPFAQLVLTALSSNRLTAVDAARYLDLRFERFDELRRCLAESSISPSPRIY
jgi:hypothetical protein